jgi:hypothetical protein
MMGTTVVVMEETIQRMKVVPAAEPFTTEPACDSTGLPVGD